jgi:acetyl esterase/lipase
MNKQSQVSEAAMAQAAAEQQPGRVRVENDVVFGTGNGPSGSRDLKCNVYHPPQEGTNRPAVLLVHGGSWINGDRTQLHGYGILLGRLGYVCVSTEYRLAGESKWPAQLHDVKACLRWMRANAGRLGIDANKISVEGNSAGAHLSLMIAGTQNVAEFEGDGGNPGVPTDVAACIAIYAPTKLYGDDDPHSPELLQFLFGKGAPVETAKKASPVDWASAKFPPTLLVTGNKDLIVPDASSFRMYQRLIAAGVSTELHVYADQPHAFDQQPPFGRQVAAIMALFLDRYVTHASGLAESPPDKVETNISSAVAAG